MDATIVNSINRFCTIDRANEVELFFQVNPLPSSERRISQSIEVIRTNSQMLEMIKVSKLSDEKYWQ